MKSLLLVVLLATVVAGEEYKNWQRIKWPGAKEWKDTWDAPKGAHYGESGDAIKIPTHHQWKDIGVFYTYGPRYMLQLRKVGEEVEYRIHFHVDKHSDDTLKDEQSILGRYGYARVFQSNYTAALNFVNTATGRNWASWKDMVTCSHDHACLGAWTPDADLMDQNSTILRVLHAVPAQLTVRCHDHENGLWCHNRVREFNEGFFYIVEVQPDNLPKGQTRVAAIMCHDWPEGVSNADMEPPHCHSTPVDGVVAIVAPEMWDTVKLPNAVAMESAHHQSLLEMTSVHHDMDLPTTKQWHDIGVFYTYGPRYMLQYRKKGDSIEYRIHFHVDHHSDGTLKDEQGILAKFGYARIFNNDYQKALEFMNGATGRHFASWDELRKCGADPTCQGAWTPDPKLMDQNSTIVNILHAIPAPLTVRCHDHDNGLWCHNRVQEFNKGFYYIVEVAPDNEPGVTRIAAVMCHDWPEGISTINMNPPHCHSTPVDGIVGLVAPELWDTTELPTAKDWLTPDAQITHFHAKQHGERTNEELHQEFDKKKSVNMVRIKWPGEKEWRNTW